MKQTILELGRKVAKQINGSWKVTPIYDLTDRGFFEKRGTKIQLFFSHDSYKNRLSIKPSYPVQGWQHFVKPEDKPKTITIAIKRGSKGIEKRLLPAYLLMFKQLEETFANIYKQVHLENDALSAIGELTHAKIVTDDDYYGTYQYTCVYFDNHLNDRWPEGEAKTGLLVDGKPRIKLKLKNLTQKETEALIQLLFKLRGLF